MGYFCVCDMVRVGEGGLRSSLFILNSDVVKVKERKGVLRGITIHGYE